MRVFIGLQPDGDFLDRLEVEVVPLRREFPDLKWVPPENRHLTLRFLGETPPEKVNRICDHLRSHPPRIPPLALSIDRFGGFPARSDLRVIWAGVAASGSLATLHNWLETRLAEAGIAAEERPFHAHITLARSRTPFTYPQLKQKLRQTTFQEIRFPADSIKVFQSRLTPAGPQYSLLKEIPFEHA
ncbi:MAG: RNA 2',3'-cyclic phosphodiesterase [Acidobacteriota bacterium]|jgi:2'-5' RNA ligase|nr:RNA 2',3'-cyclic phosphodiesterase [Acidobacteriota bacterium]